MSIPGSWCYNFTLLGVASLLFDLSRTWVKNTDEWPKRLPLAPGTLLNLLTFCRCPVSFSGNECDWQYTTQKPTPCSSSECSFKSHISCSVDRCRETKLIRNPGDNVPKECAAAETNSQHLCTPQYKLLVVVLAPLVPQGSPTCVIWWSISFNPFSTSCPIRCFFNNLWLLWYSACSCIESLPPLRRRGNCLRQSAAATSAAASGAAPRCCGNGGHGVAAQFRSSIESTFELV